MLCMYVCICKTCSTLERCEFSSTINLPSGSHSAIVTLPFAERWNVVRVDISPRTVRWLSEK